MKENTTHIPLTIMLQASIKSLYKNSRKTSLKNLSLLKVKGLSLLSTFIIITGFSFTSAQKDESALVDFTPYTQTTSVQEKAEFLYNIHGKNAAMYSKSNVKHNDTLLYFIKDLHKLGVKENNSFAIAVSSFTLGWTLYKNSYYKEAKDKIQLALNIYKNMDIDTMLIDPITLLGNIHYRRGEFKAASSHYEEALAISKNITVRTNDRKYEMSVLVNLANIDMANKDYDSAEEKILETIEFYSKNRNLVKLSRSYSLLAENYMNKDEIQLAIENFITSMKYGLATGSHNKIASAYTNLGIAEFFSENYKRSEEYFKLAVEYRIEQGHRFKEGEGYFNLADFYLELKSLDSAIVYNKKAIDVANAENFLGLKKDALHQQSSIYSVLGLKDSHIGVLMEIIELQEELSRIQMKDNSKLINLSYEQDVEEQIGSSINREGQLLSKLNNFQNIFNNWVLISLTSLGVLAALLYFRRKKKQTS